MLHFCATGLACEICINVVGRVRADALSTRGDQLSRAFCAFGLTGAIKTIFPTSLAKTLSSLEESFHADTCGVILIVFEVLCIVAGAVLTIRVVDVVICITAFVNIAAIRIRAGKASTNAVLTSLIRYEHLFRTATSQFGSGDERRVTVCAGCTILALIAANNAVSAAGLVDQIESFLAFAATCSIRFKVVGIGTESTIVDIFAF